MKILKSKNKNFYNELDKILCRRKVVDRTTLKTVEKIIDDVRKNKDKALIKYEEKSIITLSNLIGYMIVSILSFIALILLLDTFQIQLSSIFPNLELLLYNLYETMKDMLLFVRDLIR